MGYPVLSNQVIFFSRLGMSRLLSATFEQPLVIRATFLVLATLSNFCFSDQIKGLQNARVNNLIENFNFSGPPALVFAR